MWTYPPRATLMTACNSSVGLAGTSSSRLGINWKVRGMSDGKGPELTVERVRAMSPKRLHIYVVQFHPTSSGEPVPPARVPADTGQFLSVSALRLSLDGQVIADFPRIKGFHKENIPHESPRG